MKNNKFKSIALALAVLFSLQSVCGMDNDNSNELRLENIKKNINKTSSGMTKGDILKLTFSTAQKMRNFGSYGFKSKTVTTVTTGYWISQCLPINYKKNFIKMISTPKDTVLSPSKKEVISFLKNTPVNDTIANFLKKPFSPTLGDKIAAFTGSTPVSIASYFLEKPLFYSALTLSLGGIFYQTFCANNEIQELREENKKEHQKTQNELEDFKKKFEQYKAENKEQHETTQKQNLVTQQKIETFEENNKKEFDKTNKNIDDLKKSAQEYADQNFEKIFNHINDFKNKDFVEFKNQSITNDQKTLQEISHLKEIALSTKENLIKELKKQKDELIEKYTHNNIDIESYKEELKIINEKMLSFKNDIDQSKIKLDDIDNKITKNGLEIKNINENTYKIGDLNNKIELFIENNKKDSEEIKNKLNKTNEYLEKLKNNKGKGVNTDDTDNNRDDGFNFGFN